MDKSPWIEYLLDNHKNEIPRKELVEMITWLHDLMRKEDYNTINFLVKNVLDKDSSVEAIIFILRGTFVVKHQLVGWQELLKQAHAWISNKGLNSNDILKGLDQE